MSNSLTNRLPKDTPHSYTLHIHLEVNANQCLEVQPSRMGFLALKIRTREMEDINSALRSRTEDLCLPLPQVCVFVSYDFIFVNL